MIARAVTEENGVAELDIAGYEGKEIGVRIADDDYVETTSIKIKIPEARRGGISALPVSRETLGLIGISLAVLVVVIHSLSRRRRGEEEMLRILEEARRLMYEREETASAEEANSFNFE